MTSDNRLLKPSRKRLLPPNVVRKPTGLNFDGYFFDFKHFKFWGFTKPFSEDHKVFFELDLHEYPVTHECIINEVMIVP